MSGSEERSGASPAEKIEWLISEAKKVKAEIDAKTGQPEEKRVPVLDESLKEEIRATLTETSDELSRIAGLLVEEKEAEREQALILPRFCCYCGRRLLPNAVYCDRCGAHVKGI